MRALYYPQVTFSQKLLEVSGEDFNHLVHVIRIKTGEAIRIIIGEGKSTLAIVEEIKKKSLFLKLGQIENFPKPIHSKIFVGTVKKEAMSDIIRFATELMVSELYFIETEFSQRLELNNDRIEKLVKNAVEQSNNHYPTKVQMGLSWQHALEQIKTQEQIFLMHRGCREAKKTQFSNASGFTLLLGPEGGFSEDEIKSLLQLAPVIIDLPTAILRSPTALAAGMGWILSQNCH